MEDNLEQRLARKRVFSHFCNDWTDSDGWNLKEHIAQDMIDKSEKFQITRLRSSRLSVHVQHLRKWDPRVTRQLLDRPAEFLPGFQDAVKDYAMGHPDLEKVITAETEVLIGIKGDFGNNEFSPRTLSSAQLGKLVKVYGIVTKCSLVRPKIVKITSFCPATRLSSTTEYRDVTALIGLPTGSSYPIRDDAGHALLTEYGLSKYRDNQMVTIQELPETAPAGQLPHSVDIILENDLVDSVKPGDRVAVVGIFRPLPSASNGQTSGSYRSVVVGISTEKLTQDKIQWRPEDVANIHKLAQRPWALQLLARSLAPSIYGHEKIKMGLVLMLMGGIERVVNKTHIRGDINCLLVGDPGVAKSQLLRAIMNIAPHAISTTGRGSSGVGLTAAVTTDSETGEKRLEAGAMVLADRGVVCIDEFDKVSDEDRVAIHEVMEQQTVTIAKAGIQASLNARCSVLAAANPLYGSYDRQSTITKNVNLPDSLLSRFDMLFLVLDQTDNEQDRRIAEHVLRQHAYRAEGETAESAPTEKSICDILGDKDYAELEPTSVWLSGSAAISARAKAAKHGEGGMDDDGDDDDEEGDGFDSLVDCPGADDDEDDDDDDVTVDNSGGEDLQKLSADQRALMNAEMDHVLHPDFVKRFVLYVRRHRYNHNYDRMKISEAAAAKIREIWVTLRSGDQNGALPVTARSLESIIRLSQAHAKLHLRDKVRVVDVAAAEEIVRSVLDQLEPQDREEYDEEEEQDEQQAATAAAADRNNKRAREEEAAGNDGDNDQDGGVPGDDGDDAGQAAGPSVPAAKRRASAQAGRWPMGEERNTIYALIEAVSGADSLPITMPELQALAADKGIQVELSALKEFIRWVCQQAEQEDRPVGIPNIMWLDQGECVCQIP